MTWDGGLGPRDVTSERPGDGGDASAAESAWRLDIGGEAGALGADTGSSAADLDGTAT